MAARAGGEGAGVVVEVAATAVEVALVAVTRGREVGARVAGRSGGALETEAVTRAAWPPGSPCMRLGVSQSREPTSSVSRGRVACTCLWRESTRGDSIDPSTGNHARRKRMVGAHSRMSPLPVEKVAMGAMVVAAGYEAEYRNEHVHHSTATRSGYCRVGVEGQIQMTCEERGGGPRMLHGIGGVRGDGFGVLKGWDTCGMRGSK